MQSWDDKLLPLLGRALRNDWISVRDWEKILLFCSPGDRPHLLETIRHLGWSPRSTMNSPTVLCKAVGIPSNRGSTPPPSTLVSCFHKARNSKKQPMAGIASSCFFCRRWPPSRTNWCYEGKMTWLGKSEDKWPRKYLLLPSVHPEMDHWLRGTWL